MGDPIDPLFDDRDIFADFFTRYYTDWEPEHTLITEADGKVVGYLTGCAKPRRYAWAQIRIFIACILPKVIARVLTFKYSAKNLRFFAWFILNGPRETPSCPRGSAHFHINLLKPWRQGLASRRMVFAFVQQLRTEGVQRVYGQIQTYAQRRPAKVFKRFGFYPFDKRRLTRFKRFTDDEIYVTTMVKEIA